MREHLTKAIIGGAAGSVVGVFCAANFGEAGVVLGFAFGIPVAILIFDLLYKREHEAKMRSRSKHFE
jgi:drug/metabolite transporter (DMT)-like permease